MTDTKTLNRDLLTEKPTDKPAEPKRILDLSATQLTGGALAAMTSAVIGARLGVAGTIIGAAIGSVVAGVAGSLYTASLTRTKDKIASVIVGRAGDTTVAVETVRDDTAVLDGSGIFSPSAAAGAPASIAPIAAHAVLDEQGRSARRLPWRGILVSTAAVFLLAIAGITGFELASGHTLSGGEGTTVSQVSEGRSGGSDAPSESPSVTPSSETSTEASSSVSASSEPSSSATSEPSSEPTTSTSSNHPSQSTEQTASGGTTASGNPSADGGVSAAENSAGGQAGAGG